MRRLLTIEVCELGRMSVAAADGRVKQETVDRGRGTAIYQAANQAPFLVCRW